MFLSSYLPKAMPTDALGNDKRDIRHQLQALGFYDTRFDCPTNAGIIMFGNNVERFLPGAYIQYVKFKGKDKGATLNVSTSFQGI